MDKFRIADKKYLAPLCDVAIRLSPKFKPQNASVCLKSFAKLGQKDLLLKLAHVPPMRAFYLSQKLMIEDAMRIQYADSLYPFLTPEEKRYIDQEAKITFHF